MQDFRCLQCGFCCQLDVVLSRDDRTRLRQAGYSRYSRVKKGEVFLKKRGKYCIFYHGAKCTIYKDRPMVCRRFPYEKDGSLSERCLQRKDFGGQVAQKIVRFMVNESAAAGKTKKTDPGGLSRTEFSQRAVLSAACFSDNSKLLAEYSIPFEPPIYSLEGCRLIQAGLRVHNPGVGSRLLNIARFWSS